MPPKFREALIRVPMTLKSEDSIQIKALNLFKDPGTSWDKGPTRRP
jgi:hypothetical protein